MKFGLKDSVIDAINGVMAGWPEVEEGIVFGSRAVGAYLPSSDIDIAIKGKALTQKITDKIWLQLDDLLLPYMIDLLLFDAITHPVLKEHIRKEGCVLYCASGSRTAPTPVNAIH